METVEKKPEETKNIKGVLKIWYSPANVLKKESFELGIYLTRSKEEGLEIMKKAIKDPKSVKIEITVTDTLKLGSKIKEMENGTKETTRPAVKLPLV